MNYISKYFKPEELVGPEIYNKYTNKNDIYNLFDKNLLIIIDLIREWVKYPLICNNWKIGGPRKESGLRDINSNIGAKKSAHKLGKAVDLICKELTPQEIHKIIEDNKNLLPCKIRIEKTSNGKPITWTHIDTNSKSNQIDKIYYFNA